MLSKYFEIKITLNIMREKNLNSIV